MQSRQISSSSGHLVAASLSDTGKVREENQDACYADTDFGLFVTCDGMGGHQAGAMAARVVTEVLPEMIQRRLSLLRTPRNRTIRYWLRSDILSLSERIRKESILRSEFAGMGTTLVIALVQGDQVHIAHMGDSRAYLFREHKLTQLTEDHSVIHLLLDNGEITPEEAADHPARGQLTRYMGMESEVYPDATTVSVRANDRLLLCTDGLTGMLPDQAISRTLEYHHDPQEACHALVDAANAAGGRDNITTQIVDCPERPFQW